jgi:SAM-dependent methyltransferase
MSVDRPRTVTLRFRCPRCGTPLTNDAAACPSQACAFSRTGFPSCSGQPVLIDSDASIVDATRVVYASAAPPRVARRLADRFVPPNVVASRIARRLAADAVALAAPRRPLVLVIGGGTIGNGLQSLYADARLDVVAFDVYASPHTQFVADAHAIPLVDACVDAVVVQAVLEHVLTPARVVAEIHRVLRPNGLVYADTPFLQHVHEGPYDFTRFTESGHRWLFRNFVLVESGVVAGVGTQLAWSVAHAMRSIVPRRGVASFVRFAMTPLAIAIDRFAHPRYAVDGASSVYFYGRRASESIRPQDMIAHYRGAQQTPPR